MRRLCFLGPLLGVLLLTSARSASAQTIKADTKVWCDDATTVCWTVDRSWLSGVRFVFEPQLGVLVQSGKNRFDSTNLKALEKIGLATTLWGKQVGLQLLFIYPSTVQFDAQSPVRVNKQLLDAEAGKVDVDWGLTFGLTLIDGVLSTGVGILRYDPRDFINVPANEKSIYRDTFFYLNIQVVEALKSAIKKSRVP